jgi:hypothetical protein
VKLSRRGLLAVAATAPVVAPAAVAQEVWSWDWYIEALRSIDRFSEKQLDLLIAEALRSRDAERVP